jgi:hypothetical protein
MRKVYFNSICLYLTACPKPVDKRKRKSVCAARISALYYNRAQINEILKH